MTNNIIVHKNEKFFMRKFLKLFESGEKNMQITDVRLRKVNSENRMKAVASVTFDNEFVVHDIKVIEGDKGLFIAMPSRKTVDGEFRDIAHPINSDTREKIQTYILERYQTALLDADTADDVMAEAAADIYE